MSGRIFLLGLLAVCAWGIASGGNVWTQTCPDVCRCEWYSGKRSADCHGKDISAVPSDLSAEAQQLDLTLNPLEYALTAKAFSSVGLVNLNMIDLRSCWIENIDKDAFSGLGSLSELYLSGNRIKELRRDTFRGTPKLRLLNLIDNPIEWLEEGLFTNLNYLTTLYVSDCGINWIGSKVFEHVPNLETLTLYSNRLSNVELVTVEPLQKLKHLIISDNPWRCDCHLRQFRDWAISKNLIMGAQPTCDEPPSLKGKSWDVLNSADFTCDPRVLYPPAEKTVVD